MTLDITEDEALVLFALLSRYEQPDGRLLKIECAAERNALWALAATLERKLVAPLRQDYDDQLTAARDRVEKQGGSWDLSQPSN